MSADVTCFLLELTELGTEYLRRYRLAEDCPGGPYHDACQPLGQVLRPRQPTGDNFPHDDPRWPTTCESCPYVFSAQDEWQHGFIDLYRRNDNGKLLSLASAPPGAMWDATWYGPEWKGPDGKSLVVRLPNRIDWTIDGPTRSGGRWTRTGTPPKITVRPSILADQNTTNTYHGYLTDGVLIADR